MTNTVFPTQPFVVRPPASAKRGIDAMEGRAIVVSGAGFDLANGVYVFHTATDQRGSFQKLGMYMDVRVQFTIFKCLLPNGEYRWFLSVTQPDVKAAIIEADPERDIYTAASESPLADGILAKSGVPAEAHFMPPHVGWTKTNHEYAFEPPPTLYWNPAGDVSPGGSDVSDDREDDLMAVQDEAIEDFQDSSFNSLSGTSELELQDMDPPGDHDTL